MAFRSRFLILLFPVWACGTPAWAEPCLKDLLRALRPAKGPLLLAQQHNPAMIEAFGQNPGSCGPTCIVNTEQIFRQSFGLPLLTEAELQERSVSVFYEIKAHDQERVRGSSFGALTAQVGELPKRLGKRLKSRRLTVMPGEDDAAHVTTDLAAPLLEELDQDSVLLLSVADFTPTDPGDPDQMPASRRATYVGPCSSTIDHCNGYHVAVAIPLAGRPGLVELVDPMRPGVRMTARLAPFQDTKAGIRTLRLQTGNDGAGFFESVSGQDLRIRSFISIHNGAAR